MSNEKPDSADSTILNAVAIVSAYVSHNSLRAADLPDLIGLVHAALRDLDKLDVQTAAPQAAEPAVAIKKSVHRDYLVCLEDGKKFKSLRRHLNSFHKLSPAEYRAKWNLPSDYPMVAPAYSATRSQLAKDSGLGQLARSAPDADDAAGIEASNVGAADENVVAKPKRGRPRKTPV